MNKQTQWIGAGIAAIVVSGLLWFVFRPSDTPDVADVDRNKPEVEALREAPKPVVTPRPAAREPAPVTAVAADHPFLKIPVQQLPDIPNSIKDPLGVLPITREAMEMSVNEMRGDIDECRDAHLPPELHRVISIDFNINSEVPPEDYGPPTAGEYGIVRGAKVMDTNRDLSAFEDCMTRAMEDILYDKPAGSGSRVNWSLDLTP